MFTRTCGLFSIVVSSSKYVGNFGQYRYLRIYTMYKPVYANYIGPSVMTDANSEGFPNVMKELLKMTDVS